MMPSASVDPALLAGGERALGLVVDDRDVQQRLAAEERQRQALRLQLVEPLLDPGREPRAVVERHPIGVFVVVAVVALKAVIAREIALQRRQHRHAHLLGVFAVIGEELVQRFGVGGAARHDEAVLGQRHQRFPRVAVEPIGRKRRGVVGQAIEQAGDVVRDDQLRVGQRVHQKHFAPLGECDTKVEHRLLHGSTVS